MSATLAVQTAIYNALRNASAVTTLLAESVITDDTGKAVYDMPPQFEDPEASSNFPYIAIGEFTATDFDTDDTDGMDQTRILHIWDRYQGRKRVQQIMDAIYATLHDATLTVTGHNAVLCLCEFASTVPDEDGLTQHGVMRVRIVTQDT